MGNEFYDRGSEDWATHVMLAVRDLVDCRQSKTSRLILQICQGAGSLERAELEARLGGRYDEQSEYDPVVASDPDRWPPHPSMAFLSGPVYGGSAEVDARSLAWGPRAHMALTIEATPGVVHLVESLHRTGRKPSTALAWGDGLAEAIEAARGGQRDGLLRVRAAAMVIDDEFRRGVRRGILQDLIDEDAVRHLMVFPPEPTAEIARQLCTGEIHRPRSMAAGYPIRVATPRS
jgi:hypothetical protein